MKKLNFNELSLSPEMQQAIAEMGFTEASPIQSEAIPYLLEGHDVIGQAQTGTGKTAAFGIPLLEKIESKSKHTQALVMCPTRELAQQVAQELKRLAKYKRGIVILPVYGGEQIQKQISALKRSTHVIVGTPGRIIDHLERRTISFEHVNCVVLDEADEMLNMGFREDIETILSKIAGEKQTVLFSATMPKPILDITKRFQKTPKHVKVTRDELTVAAIEQVYFELSSSQRTEVMARLIDLHNLKLMLVFCNTKRKVDEVVQQMIELGYKADAIHGDLNQSQRNNVLSKFKHGRINIMVATDVAARGIDVDNVDAVFNYDLPLDPEYYVHRIGRTGRAGKSGKSFTFVTGRNESGRLREIERYAKVRIERQNTPSRKELLELSKQKLAGKIKEITATPDQAQYDKMIHDFMSEGITLHQLAAGLLKMHLGPAENESQSSGKRSDGRGERGERGNRSERNEPRERYPRKGNMVRLFVSVGKKDRVSKGDIAGAFASLSGIHGEDIGIIDLYDKFSFVEVMEKDLNRVLERVNGNKVKGRKVNIEIAKD
jgi:ATP-dependent RNA helicase DeaD